MRYNVGVKTTDCKMIPIFNIIFKLLNCLLYAFVNYKTKENLIKYFHTEKLH